MTVGVGEVLGLIAIFLGIGLVILIAWKGKGLLRLQILQGSRLKQLRFMFSMPDNAVRVIHIPESGLISQHLLPVNNGWVDMKTDKFSMTWLLIHALKMKVQEDGKPFQDEEVLLVTSRSYIPLDPFNILGDNREKLTALSEIGGMHHDEVMFATGRKGMGQTIQQKIIDGSFVLLGMLALIWFLKGVFIK